MLEHNCERNLLSVSSQKVAERMLRTIVERDDPLLWLNDCNVSQKNLDLHLLKQHTIMKATDTAAVQQETKWSLLENEKRLLQKTNKELMILYHE